MKGRPYEPACWSWPVPPVITDVDAEVARILAAQAHLPVDEQRSPEAVRYVLTRSPNRSRFTAFHAGRCAICGLPSAGWLIEDHDHRTGLLRGLLCQGCNVSEGRSGHEVYDLYRERPPAVIVGYRGYYVGGAWSIGWWRDTALARRLTGNPEWTLDSGREQPLLP